MRYTRMFKKKGLCLGNESRDVHWMFGGAGERVWHVGGLLMSFTGDIRTVLDVIWWRSMGGGDPEP